jgi:hypothetical protein
LGVRLECPVASPVTDLAGFDGALVQHGVVLLYNATKGLCGTLLLQSQDPALRPNAQELLQHEWIQYNRRTLRSSWSRAQGYKTRGGRSTDAHESVNSVISRILHAEGSEDDPMLVDGVAAADSVGPATPTVAAAPGTSASASAAAAVRTVDAVSGPLATSTDTPGSVVLMRDAATSSSSLEQEAYHPQQQQQQQQQRVVKKQVSSSSSGAQGQQQQQAGSSIELSSSQGAVRDAKGVAAAAVSAVAAAAAGHSGMEGVPGPGPGSKDGPGLSRAKGQQANNSSNNIAAADQSGSTTSQQQQQFSVDPRGPNGALSIPGPRTAEQQQQEGPPGPSGGSGSSGYPVFMGQQLRYAPAAAHTPRVGGIMRSGSLMEVPESPLSSFLARLQGDVSGCETPASGQVSGSNHLLAWLDEGPGSGHGGLGRRSVSSSSRDFGRAMSPMNGGILLADVSVSSRGAGGDSLGVEATDSSFIMESRRKVREGGLHLCTAR